MHKEMMKFPSGHEKITGYCSLCSISPQLSGIFSVPFFLSPMELRFRPLIPLSPNLHIHLLLSC